MARDGSGTFNLAAGNPVTTGTQITATWGNTTLADIASALTGSVAADGQTPITGPLKCAAGSVSAPSFTFSAETNTGFYKSASNVVSLAIAGSQKYILGASSVTLAGSASITGTEFGYLTGVSSAIQTQLDAKQGLDATLTALAGTLTAANKIPYATNTDTAGELTFNPSTALAASTSTVPSQTVVKTAVDELVANCSSATPDTSADYFVFEDATDSTQKKALLNTISPFTSSYTSPSPATFASVQKLVENHGLGAAPKAVSAVLRCVTTDAGYAVGDEIHIASHDAPGNGGNTIWSNATQVGYNNAYGTPRVCHKTTGALTTLTYANWVVVLRAWK